MPNSNKEMFPKIIIIALLIVVVIPSLLILNVSHNKIQIQNESILGKLELILNQDESNGDNTEQGESTTTAMPLSADMEFVDKKLGTGNEAKNGMTVKIDYTGKLTDGKIFDSSKGKKPLEFIIGAKMVVPGFEKGVLGMKEGGVRTINIPPQLAYGDKGIPGVIPPNSTLIFEIELVSATMNKPDAQAKKEAPSVTPEAPKDIDNTQLAELLDKNTVLIDIRRPEEWKETGIVSGSNTLTLYDASGKEVPGFLDKFKKLVPTKQTPVILICRTGNRTSFAAKALADGFGYENIYNVKKGITDWISSGNKVVEYK